MSKLQFKVCYLVSTLGRTGPTRQLYNLTKYLNKNDFSPSIIILSKNPPDNLQDQFEKLGVQVHSLGLSRFSSVFLGKYRLKALLSCLQPDLLHSQGLRADWLSSKLRLPLLRVATRRNTPALDYPPLMGRVPGQFAALAHERAFRNLPVVVACGTSVCPSCERNNSAQRVIHNGVDLEHAPRVLGDAQKAAERARINLSPNAKVFICSGPLIARKNIFFLLDQFRAGRTSDKHLLVLGDGPLRGVCEDYAKDLQNVSFLGNRPNVWEYLRLADYFVSSSKAEGMPNAVLEALASGLPVLLSDIPSHQEILSLSPKVGKLFKLDDSTSFMQAIDDLVKTPELDTNARTLVEKYFSADIMSAHYQRLYRQLICELSEEGPA